MKQKKVTYGMNGMLEYQAIIKVGNAKLNIRFSNGTINEAGRYPATYTTTNYFEQQAIERSPLFTSGKIYKVFEAQVDGEVYIESDHVAKAGDIVEIADEDEKGEDAGDDAHEATEDAPNEEANDEKGEDAGDDAHEATEDAPNEEANDEKGEDAGIIVTVADLDEAKDYLVSTFGLTRSRLSSKAKTLEAAEQRGVVFEGI